MNFPAPSEVTPIRVRFRHLGPVRDADLELGTLTIVAGRNNTGKTYMVYTVYGLLKHFQLNHSWKIHSRNSYSTWIKTFVADARTKGIDKWKLRSRDFLSHRDELLSEYSNFFSDTMLADIFRSRREEFARAQVSIKIPDSPSRIKENMKNFARTFPRNDPQYPLHYDGINLSVSPSLSSQEVMQSGFESDHLVDQYRRLLVPELSADISIISAERFGISLFYKELDFTKNQLVEVLQKLRDKGYSSDEILYLISDRASSRYALPIRDNIHFTRRISEIRTDKGELHDERLFERIERLLDGSYSASDEELRFQSKPAEGASNQGSAFDIPLHLASSSARGLSDLYFFLKHEASHNHLLIIDEPESHLDTENQVQLARMLARFVRAGVRVLITTHSDYLLKEINNLIMLSMDFKDKEHVKKSLGYSEDDFLEPRLIRAYVAENGGLSPCLIDSLGIDFPVFDRVIDKINRASTELITRVDN